MYKNHVSICILTLNKYEVTERALQTLRRTNFPSEAELILVDNCSIDGTPGRLIEFQRTHGCDKLRVTVVLNEVNRGCAGGRNMAAALATKECLVFIDNDIEFHDPEWLRKGLEFTNRSSAGVVGGKLIYADRPDCMQAAGVAIDTSGNVRYIGDGDDPGRPEYNVAKEVQGVAGACFFIGAALFRQAGGFDESFNPVNYEDLDLCYRIRQRGYRVLYTPDVSVLHRAHTTTHRTPELQIRRVNIRNQQMFRERWAAVLEAEQASHRNEGMYHGKVSSEKAGTCQSQGPDRGQE
jgi:O-antigen biosynthesis protein